MYRTSAKPNDVVVTVEVADMPPAKVTGVVKSEKIIVECECSQSCSGHFTVMTRKEMSKGNVAVSVQAMYDPIAETSNDMMNEVRDVMFNQSTDLSDPPSIEAMRKDSGSTDTSMRKDSDSSIGGTDSESSLNSSSIDATNAKDYDSTSVTTDDGKLHDILLNKWEKRKRDNTIVWTHARLNSDGEVEYAITKEDPDGKQPSAFKWFATPSAALLKGGLSNGNPYSLWIVPASLAGRKAKAGAKPSPAKSKSGANSNND